MKYFFLISNILKDKDLVASNHIMDYLKKKGGICQMFVNDMRHEQNEKYTLPTLVPEDTEAILVIGGDGTMLQAARDLGELQIPFLGFNFGKLGYLAEVDKDHIEQTLDRLLKDDYKTEERMMLSGKVFHKEKEIAHELALNDIVLIRSGMLQVLDYNVYVNKKLLYTYSADGMIVATPTGSTAYNLSAGGPIVEPEAKLVLLTPISPHTLNSRSIVLGAEKEITLEILPSRSGNEGRLVSFDGDKNLVVTPGDRIIIKKSEMSIKIIKMTDLSFLRVLQKKLQN